MLSDVFFSFLQLIPSEHFGKLALGSTLRKQGISWKDLEDKSTLDYFSLSDNPSFYFSSVLSMAQETGLIFLKNSYLLSACNKLKRKLK